MQIIKDKITIKELEQMSEKMFGGLVKAHADQEAFLIEKGSKQNDLWGINLYPEKNVEDFIEFDSMINIRPSFDNRTRGVDDVKIREKIIEIVNKLVKR